MECMKAVSFCACRMILGTLMPEILGVANERDLIRCTFTMLILDVPSARTATFGTLTFWDDAVVSVQVCLVIHAGTLAVWDDTFVNVQG